jgi:hypothetical protein
MDDSVLEKEGKIQEFQKKGTQWTVSIQYAKKERSQRGTKNIVAVKERKRRKKKCIKSWEKHPNVSAKFSNSHRRNQVISSKKTRKFFLIPTGMKGL